MRRMRRMMRKRMGVGKRRKLGRIGKGRRAVNY
jgi:hypothetical protein